jgi:Holliday junction resolvase RusA-like endonuclease
VDATAVRHADDRPFDWLRVEVNGIPSPAGSKSGFAIPGTNRVVIVDAAKRSRGWKNDVADEAARAMAGDLWRGPLLVQIVFGFPRPKAHFGTGRNADQVKSSAPHYHVVRPDVDKLSRAVMDALRGVVYADDSQVVCKTVSKQYEQTARTVIFVRKA